MSTSTGATVRRLDTTLPVLGLAILLFAFLLVPPVRGDASLTWSFLGTGAFLVAWALLLWARPGRRSRGFGVDLVRPLKSHYVQACIQITIYTYWAFYWPPVVRYAPLIVAQLVFMYAFDALLTWSRGRNWRLGFGPLPVILSTNLFLWFRNDWFYLQFALVASCVLGKEFVRWQRGGRNTHIFNPAAFGLGLFSLVLIATHKTVELTWGVEVATTLNLAPYMYALIFGLGLIVQYLFSVTLMTLSAVVALVVLNLGYTGSTGVYYFVDTNIPIAVFLGLHLLMTDPSTSPRTNTGRVIFGSLYGVGTFLFYSVLRDLGAPEFYDKLLTVPVLNLSVQLLDRLARGGLVGTIERWQARFGARAANLVYMGCWSTLCLTLLGTGWIEGDHHPGASVAFWRQAASEDKPRARENLLRILESRAAAGSASAMNQIGLLYLEGELVERNERVATDQFARSCELGDLYGCANLVERFLALDGAQPADVVMRGLAMLEQSCSTRSLGRICYLVGRAYETGRGRTLDRNRALRLYQQAAVQGNVDACKALARTSILEASPTPGLADALRGLERAGEEGDATSCVYLAYFHHSGVGVPRDEARSRALLERASQLGAEDDVVARSNSGGWDEWLDALRAR